MPTHSIRIAQPSAFVRTLRLWLLANLGGTAWLVADFGQDSLEDIGIPLLAGLMAALLSMPVVPLAAPLFALAQRQCASWQCRLVALAGLAVAFAACNLVLMHLLPVGPPAALLAWSLPYLGAGALAVLWMFRTQPMRTQLRVARSVKSAATLLESWRPRMRRPPALHRSVTLVTGW